MVSLGAGEGSCASETGETAVTDDDKKPDLETQFRALVDKDYSSALSILDTLGVANYKEAISKGMGDQIQLAMEAFQ